MVNATQNVYYVASKLCLRGGVERDHALVAVLTAVLAMPASGNNSGNKMEAISIAKDCLALLIVMKELR